MANRKKPRGRTMSYSPGQVSPDAVLLRLYEAEREKKLVARIIHDLNISWLMTMHDKFGFGKEMLECLYNSQMELWDGIEKNYLSAADMETVLRDEVGLEFIGK